MYGLWMCKWILCVWLVDVRVEMLCMVVRCASGDVYDWWMNKWIVVILEVVATCRW